MHIKITYRAMDHSATIEKYVRAEVATFEQLFKREEGKPSVEVILQGHTKENHFTVEFVVKSGAYSASARVEGKDVFATIHDATHNITQQIIKQKGKMLDKEHHRPKMQ
ncbi:HPF/RaiA family ribosome-associated protein [Candidatus Chromulinivorax destructor]|nr:HPF/RaiA family ribosome-associated protein [Candidatus Chromulinivorax destructor]